MKISKIVDATRVADGSQVTIKTVSRHNDEVTIARRLSSKELLRDPSNHCVPVLDVFDDPFDTSKALMVMPYLRPFDDPEFRTIGEVMDFISQTLEVSAFAHGIHRKQILSYICRVSALCINSASHIGLYCRPFSRAITDLLQ